MVLGYNILDHFETKSQQRWTWSDSPDLVTVLTTGVIPAFVLVADTAVAVGIETGTVQIFDTEDNAVGAAQKITISTAPTLINILNILVLLELVLMMDVTIIRL